MTDGLASYELAVACLREQRVRSGEYAPTDDRERRQASEGPRQPHQLDTVQDQPA